MASLGLRHTALRAASHTPETLAEMHRRTFAVSPRKKQKRAGRVFTIIDYMIVFYKDRSDKNFKMVGDNSEIRLAFLV